MKPIEARVVVGAIVTALLATAAVAADLPEITQRGAIRLLLGQVHGRTADSPPGLDEEILEGFAKQRSLKLDRVLLASWDDLVPALLAGKGDVIGGDFEETESRRKQVVFTAEVFPVHNVVVSRKPHRAIQTLAELRAEKVAVVKGTSLVEVVTAAGIPEANLFLVERRALSEGLRAGTFTATLLPLSSAIMARQRDAEMQLGMFLGPASQTAFAVRPGDEALLAALNEYLGNLRRSGGWNRLVLKHYGESALEMLRRGR